MSRYLRRQLKLIPRSQGLQGQLNVQIRPAELKGCKRWSAEPLQEGRGTFIRCLIYVSFVKTFLFNIVNRLFFAPYYARTKIQV